MSYGNNPHSPGANPAATQGPAVRFVNEMVEDAAVIQGLANLRNEFKANNVRLRIIGDHSAFPADVATLVDKAVAAHDPGAGGLWAGFRQTENAVVIPEGQGVWKSVTGLGSIQRRFLDPVQGQAGYFGTVYMGEEEAVVAIRVKVQWNQVTEAEWFISRKGDPGLTGEPGKTPFNIETLRATLPAQRVVPKAERMQREALQAVVNTYFDGITNHSGFIVKGHPGCSRYENGFPTFNTPMREGMDIGNDGKTDCRTQGDFGVAIVAIFMKALLTPSTKPEFGSLIFTFLAVPWAL